MRLRGDVPRRRLDELEALREMGRRMDRRPSILRMIARMGVLIAESAERFMSRRLLAECRTFVADERGRTAAAAGSHDDLVMAMAIGQAVRAEMLTRKRQ